MVVVKIELWPYGSEARAREIGRMYIANDGNTSVADPRFGDYLVAVCRRNSTDVPREIYDPKDEDQRELHAKAPRGTRAARVRGYPRLAYNVWRLIARAVTGAFPEELNTRKGRGEAVLDAEVVRGFKTMQKMIRGGYALSPEQLIDVKSAEAWLDAAHESKDIDAAREACGLESGT